MAKDYSHFQTALDNAHAAARAACATMRDNPRALDCGFAWVTVLDRSFAGWARRQRDVLTAQANGARIDGDEIRHIELRKAANLYGSKHHGAGWTFWCPGEFVGQSVSGHEAGAKAFAESLARETGLLVTHSSRLD